MALPQDIVTGSVGIGATVTSILGYIQPVLGALVALATLVAIVYSIKLKRRQIKNLDNGGS